MKDDKKLNEKTKIQMTQASFKAYACNEGFTVHLYSKMY